MLKFYIKIVWFVSCIDLLDVLQESGPSAYFIRKIRSSDVRASTSISFVCIRKFYKICQDINYIQIHFRIAKRSI